MIEKYITEIEQTTEDFEKDIARLDEESINWKPSDDQWSVGQVLHHLITINSSYFTVTDEIKNGAYKKPFIGKIKWLVTYFGKVILKSVQPDVPKKMRTFPIWEPSKSNLTKSIVDDFFQNQKQLANWITENKDLIEQNPVISSPANVNIVYYLQTAIEIIISHEKRHLDQLRDVLVQYKNFKGSN